MARFLRLVVEHSLAGKSGDLKEYLIGMEAFDRKPSYDPRVDPIVRVEARRLRSKLAAYYQGDGGQDEIVIELPKGSYVPKFSGRVAPPAAAAAIARSAREQQPDRTVAVLPFANTSRDPEEYFSDGLTEELIHALTKIRGLRVVAWNSAARVRGGERDIYNIGQQLGVATVLTGSVRHEGDRIRILAQLIETRSGVYLWSETYDRKIEQMFAIQQEIANSIAAALLVQFGVSEPREYNLQAYNEYLRGRYHWNKRTTDGFWRSIDHFQRSIDIDPAFALGYAGLADAYLLMVGYGIVMPGQWLPKAKEAALRALEIDSSLGEAEASLGAIAIGLDWNWVASRKHFQRSITLNPSYATAFHWFGLDHCGLLGKMDEGFPLIYKAVELDPLSSIIREGVGYMYLLNRQYDRALTELQKVLEFDEHFHRAHAAMARAHSLAGNYAESIPLFERALHLCGEMPSILAAYAQTCGRAGQIEKTRRTMTRLEDLARERRVPAACFALTHLGLGEKDCALRWLERGVGQRDLPLSIGVHPAWDELRDDTRFNVVLERIGLAELIRS